MTAPLQPPPAPLYCAVIEYDGSDFLGFQAQAQGRTVQGELEAALARLTQSPTRVIGAGRTDAGVHALGQVIAFRSEWRHSLSDLHRGLNALLPPDISAHTVALAPPHFHPRFSALARWYRYQIGIWPGHSPLKARYAWEVGPQLDLTTMNQAAAHLIGSHDFAAFGQPPQGEITIRHVSEAAWRAAGEYLLCDLRANAFLRHMVRNIVATLVWVGQGRLAPDDVAAILAQRRRAASAPPAPPQGLILMAVTYPDAFPISQVFPGQPAPSKEFIP
ncbi:MAG: tRNA pseudouridine(38-40) synthase TruA [Caldilineales bacterium]|nr:tRNA pseudouridine(38-40) synthase TruA [Caldilineales bacterium]